MTTFAVNVYWLVMTHDELVDHANKFFRDHDVTVVEAIVIPHDNLDYLHVTLYEPDEVVLKLRLPDYKKRFRKSIIEADTRQFNKGIHGLGYL